MVGDFWLGFVLLLNSERDVKTGSKHIVEITETLQRSVEVKAASAEDAERKIRAAYRAGDIVLDAEDCAGVEIVSRSASCTRFP